MDDKMTVEITGFDAEKHAEDMTKRAKVYSDMLIHQASIVSEKEYQKFLLERLERTMVTSFVKLVTLTAILQLTERCFSSSLRIHSMKRWNT